MKRKKKRHAEPLQKARKKKRGKNPTQPAAPALFNPPRQNPNPGK
jgi:hypothetical protein